MKQDKRTGDALRFAANLIEERGMGKRYCVDEAGYTVNNPLAPNAYQYNAWGALAVGAAEYDIAIHIVVHGLLLFVHVDTGMYEQSIQKWMKRKSERKVIDTFRRAADYNDNEIIKMDLTS